MFIVILLSSYSLYVQDFDTKDFGAIDDSKTLNTKMIQATIRCCRREGWRKVIVPKGNFLTGTIKLRSNIDLYVMQLRKFFKMKALL